MLSGLSLTHLVISCLIKIAKTLWLMLPAYTPNNFAVVFGGGKPIDFEKVFIDGRRILGDGKTFRGFAGGLFGGLIVANVEYMIENVINIHVFSSLPYLTFLKLAFALSFGSLAGDCLGSFVKRRFGVERGDKFPLLDQYDFLALSFLFAWIFERRAFESLYTPDVILLAVILTPLLHRFANIVAYKLGLKDVPW